MIDRHPRLLSKVFGPHLQTSVWSWSIYLECRRVFDEFIPWKWGPFWLFTRRGLRSHVLLASCHSQERAYEKASRGVFTGALLETLVKIGIHKLTYATLFDTWMLPLSNGWVQAQAESFDTKKKRLLHQAKPRMRGLSSGTIDIWWKSIWQTNCPCLLVNHERHKLGHRRNCPLSNKAEEGRRDLYFISNHMLFIHATDLSLHTSNITPRSIVKTLLLVIYNLDRHETHPPTYITNFSFSIIELNSSSVLYVTYKRNTNKWQPCTIIVTHTIECN